MAITSKDGHFLEAHVSGMILITIQIPIKWPQSRDEVWKENIPHTHLAHEKSDQNWMVVKGEKIVFPEPIFTIELASILLQLQRIDWLQRDEILLLEQIGYLDLKVILLTHLQKLMHKT
ncbi:hypothetical protein REPUB_Repub19eG0108500 [Reevesia pubescens]